MGFREGCDMTLRVLPCRLTDLLARRASLPIHKRTGEGEPSRRLLGEGVAHSAIFPGRFYYKLLQPELSRTLGIQFRRVHHAR